MLSPLTLVAVAVLNGWMGADLELRGDCLEVTAVWPGGPAAAGGVKDGDCLIDVTIDATPFPANGALEGIVSANGPALLRARAGARRVEVTITTPKREVLMAYCDWRQSRRFTIDVVVYSHGGMTLSQQQYAAPPSIRDIRKRIGALGSPHIEFKPDCASRPRKVTEVVTEDLRVTADATVSFGEAPPPYMFVLQDDGGRCRLPVVPSSADGGMNFGAGEESCAP